MTFKAVIFDIGGVCVGSPMAGIHRYEKEHGLPRNYINVAIVKQGEDGAFQKLERGEIRLNDFYKQFGEQLSDPRHKQNYKEYLQKSGRPVPENIPNVSVDGKALWTTMMDETNNVDVKVFHAINKLKESGQFKVAALTNNSETAADQNKTSDSLRETFDYFVESKVVGLRKPDPNFFLHACKIIGVEPHEAIFLDDIGMNLRSAKKLGMETIQVQMGRSEEAIKKLEGLVNLDLHTGVPSKL
ncbi:epoxide hydrolase [Zychaea mexicana]|uniref:epoxide hydrolase n=1 Tax=Zychaea mexicana TaxID=64656 RepID=UPI0022FDC0FC|nr:epoxide hydrolase [Zychaea mexicana]KAI9496453.1 epoxide hydrolase [Zychaea mexicana]